MIAFYGDKKGRGLEYYVILFRIIDSRPLCAPEQAEAFAAGRATPGMETNLIEKRESRRAWLFRVCGINDSSLNPPLSFFTAPLCLSMWTWNRSAGELTPIISAAVSSVQK